MPACPRPGGYVPRQTHECDAAVLVRRHLPGFLARLEEDGHALPEFVKKEFWGFAGCGAFERGFVRTACRTCGDELRVDDGQDPQRSADEAWRRQVVNQRRRRAPCSSACYRS